MLTKVKLHEQSSKSNMAKKYIFLQTSLQTEKNKHFVLIIALPKKGNK